MAGIASEAKSQSLRLASLETELRQVAVAVEEVRDNVTQRLNEVEGTALGEEDVARVFGEEMDKNVENSSSVLWVWLSGVSLPTTCN